MIKFNFQKPASLPNRKKLKDFINLLFRKEGYTVGHIQLIFCSDEFLLNINKEFLQHNYYTDIISFGEQSPDKIISGELYISIDRVKDNAKSFHKTFQNELHRVIFHGLLHLCGYLDKAQSDLMLMRKKEDHYLESYFDVPHGTVS